MSRLHVRALHVADSMTIVSYARHMTEIHSQYDHAQAPTTCNLQYNATCNKSSTTICQILSVEEYVLTCPYECAHGKKANDRSRDEGKSDEFVPMSLPALIFDTWLLEKHINIVKKGGLLISNQSILIAIIRS